MLFGQMSFVFEVMIYVGIGLPLLNLLLSGLSGMFTGSGAEAGGAEADLELGDSGLDFATEVELAAEGLEIEVETPFEADFDTATELDAGAGELELDGAPQGVATGWRVPLRFNIYCLCLALVVMGATGIFALEAFAPPLSWLMLAVGAALALLSYWLLYRFVVYPLKKNNPRALGLDDLVYKHALVTFRITQDSPGKIRAKDAVGAYITYPAKLDEDLCKTPRIEQGEEVIITEVNRQENLCYVIQAQRKH